MPLEKEKRTRKTPLSSGIVKKPAKEKSKQIRALLEKRLQALKKQRHDVQNAVDQMNLDEVGCQLLETQIQDLYRKEAELKDEIDRMEIDDDSDPNYFNNNYSGRKKKESSNLQNDNSDKVNDSQNDSGKKKERSNPPNDDSDIENDSQDGSGRMKKESNRQNDDSDKENKKKGFGGGMGFGSTGFGGTGFGGTGFGGTGFDGTGFGGTGFGGTGFGAMGSQQSQEKPKENEAEESDEDCFTPSDAIKERTGRDDEGVTVGCHISKKKTIGYLVQYGPRNACKYVTTTNTDELPEFSEDTFNYGVCYRQGDRKNEEGDWIRTRKEFKGFFFVAMKDGLKLNRLNPKGKERNYPPVILGTKWQIDQMTGITYETRTSISHLWHSRASLDQYIYDTAAHFDIRYKNWLEGKRQPESRSATPAPFPKWTRERASLSKSPAPKRSSRENTPSKVRFDEKSENRSKFDLDLVRPSIEKPERRTKNKSTSKSGRKSDLNSDQDSQASDQDFQASDDNISEQSESENEAVNAEKRAKLIRQQKEIWLSGYKLSRGIPEKKTLRGKQLNDFADYISDKLEKLMLD